MTDDGWEPGPCAGKYDNLEMEGKNKLSTL